MPGIAVMTMDDKVMCTNVWMTGIIRMPGMTRDDWKD